jgi:hypothetical protein
MHFLLGTHVSQIICNLMDYSPFPSVINEIFPTGRTPCIQWMCPNNLIQSIKFLALAVIE